MSSDQQKQLQLLCSTSWRATLSGPLNDTDFYVCLLKYFMSLGVGMACCFWVCATRKAYTAWASLITCFILRPKNTINQKLTRQVTSSTTANTTATTTSQLNHNNQHTNTSISSSSSNSVDLHKASSKDMVCFQPPQEVSKQLVCHQSAANFNPYSHLHASNPISSDHFQMQNYYNHANGSELVLCNEGGNLVYAYSASLMRANPQLPASFQHPMVRVPPVTLARHLMLPSATLTSGLTSSNNTNSNLVLVEEAEYSSLLAAVSK
jgi:hypothetical protein